jgi:acyl carrier protein
MDLAAQFQVREYFSARLRLKGDVEGFDDADPLFSSGRLDSLDAIETIMFLEEAFGIDFAKIDFDLTFLDSVGAIKRLIETTEPKANRSRFRNAS